MHLLPERTMQNMCVVPICAYKEKRKRCPKNEEKKKNHKVKKHRKNAFEIPITKEATKSSRKHALLWCGIEIRKQKQITRLSTRKQKRQQGNITNIQYWVGLVFVNQEKLTTPGKSQKQNTNKKQVQRVHSKIKKSYIF